MKERLVGYAFLWMAGVIAAAPFGCTSEPIRPRAELGIQPASTRFVRHTVDAAADGPAYVSVVDLDGDGKLDLVVSLLGALQGFPPALSSGSVVVYRRGASLDEWTRSPI